MKIKIKTLLFFVVLLLALYQDFPLVNIFGEIARSPIIFLTIPMLIYILMHQKLILSKYTRYFMYYILYVLIISLIFIPIVYYLNGSFLIIKENIILKAIKLFVYPLSILIFYQFVYMLFSSGKNSFDYFFNAVFTLQVLLAVYLFFEVIFLKKETIFASFLHSDNLKYYRVRLLTLEESWIGTVLTIFIFIPIFLANYLKKPKKIKQKIYAFSTFIFLYYTFFSESKGYLLLIIVSVLPMAIQYMYSHNKLRKVLFVGSPIILIIAVFVVMILQKTIDDQLHTSITFGTRLTSYLASLKVFITHPFGVGWSGFIYYYPEAIRDIINTSWVSTLNLQEIKGYLTTTKALSTKTDFFDNLMYGGLGFIVFFYNFFIKRYFFFSKFRDTNFFFIKAPLLFCILAGLIYITFYIKYEVWFLMAFLDALQSQINNKISKENENTYSS
ncbi:hypothetical protein [Flavobacterium sp. SORGH_AS_0622]|uniref:hypothetical protein n=1 Tax=Flavobacterium sp. SORGH_AS_0622 TaxID=3041772 RepID=UPI00278094A8|nr:hypothetical protein [Flavobacterium sp. SORGH_AS_0622]MDQ1168097.1 hypothetical protein [Flavobacterium sp. SORGH_AS_0622]